MPATTDPLAQPCPRCHAQAGERCRNYGGAGAAPHRDRRHPPAEPKPGTDQEPADLFAQVDGPDTSS